jgi:hypothetical protein
MGRDGALQNGVPAKLGESWLTGAQLSALNNAKLKNSVGQKCLSYYSKVH